MTPNKVLPQIALALLLIAACPTDITPTPSHTTTPTDSPRSQEPTASPTSLPTPTPTPTPPPTPTAPPPGVQHIVIAGDSWSAGSVEPTENALAAWGHGNIELTWEDTAVPGSMANQWAVNDQSKLDHLADALDGTPLGKPPADILLLYIGGNDYNARLSQGFIWRALEFPIFLNTVETDMQTMVDFALNGRPNLRVVFVDYSYLHFEWFTFLYMLDLDAANTLEYNQGLVDVGRRKLSIAASNASVHYVHNFGILQHSLGLEAMLPWSLPLVDYPPGFFDPPSAAPLYDPYPGGVRRFDIDPTAIPPESLPGPLAGYIDGVHPSAAGWDVLIQNLCDQGLCRLLQGQGWVP